MTNFDCKLRAIMSRLKVLIILVFILVDSGFIKAQNFKAQALAGMNVAQVDGDSYSGYNQPGFIGGISIYRPSKEIYNLGFELLFSQKGSHKKNTEEDYTKFKLRYTYITMPLYIDFTDLGPDFDKVTIRAAISPNFNIIAKDNKGYGWAKTDIKPFELSGYLSIGYKINDAFGFMLRHENSLLSIGRPADNAYYNINRRGLYNRLVSFIFTYNL